MKTGFSNKRLRNMLRDKFPRNSTVLSTKSQNLPFQADEVVTWGKERHTDESLHLSVLHIRKRLEEHISAILVLGYVVPWACEYRFVICIHLSVGLRMVSCGRHGIHFEESAKRRRESSQRLGAVVGQKKTRIVVLYEPMSENYGRYA